MSCPICQTCGVQYSQINKDIQVCKICAEERQYIPADGQTWTTLENMKKSNRGYKNELIYEENGLYSITTKPEFAIGQSAYLIQTSTFNILWDCITFLDEATKRRIKGLGGIQAIALSHPHYYSTQVEWAEAFDAPIYIHEDDKEWVTRPSNKIIFWSGESLKLQKGITLYRLGGHFKGGAVLHWAKGNNGKGILLTGDIIQVVPDQKWVSFMYSYPNLIPLPSKKVEQIASRLHVIPFNRIYNAFHRVVKENASDCVQKSVQRYISALEGTLFDT